MQTEQNPLQKRELCHHKTPQRLQTDATQHPAAHTSTQTQPPRFTTLRPMRDSNYKSVALNKAAVSISANLYDRRALDCTTDQPLVNSLNHLTFLTSSSAKVRETLSNDGGLKRLVAILHECHREPNLSNGDFNKPKTIHQEKQSALTAWKWTLAFQCLVLIGTRGTEEIRKSVVEAGIIPIIATVLDNYLLMVRNFDNDTDGNLTENFLTMVSNKFRSKIKSCCGKKLNSTEADDTPEYDLLKLINKDTKIYQFFQSERQSIERSLKGTSIAADEGQDHQLDNANAEMNELTFDQNLHDINETITSPRFFLNGVLIPKDDDVVWSLQLLAFISKYSNLKEYLQYTHFVDTLSLRSMLQKCNEWDQDSDLPSLEKDNDYFMDNDNDFELMSNLSSDENRHISTQDNSSLPTTAGGSASQSQHLEPATQSSTMATQSQASSTILLANTSLSNDQITERKPQPQDQRSRNLSPQLPDAKNPLSLNENSSVEEAEEDEDDDDDICSVNSMVADTVSTLPSTIASFNPKLSSITNDTRLLNSNQQIFKENKIHELELEQSGFSQQLKNSITKFEDSLNEKNEDECFLGLCELTIKLNKFYHNTNICKKIKSIMCSKTEKAIYSDKWNYETYFERLSQRQHQQSYMSSVSSSTRTSRQQSPDLNEVENINDIDRDPKTKITHPLNLFPLVEKFTLKTTNTTDMCYWSGVIMRNSCRKDLARGGVRQCAYFQCGEWEKTPKQFAKCRRCKRTKYCSKECQLKAWGYHKHWCVDSATSTAHTAASTGNANTVNESRNDATASPAQLGEIF